MVILKKGQISTEYLIVIGFVTFLIIGVLGVAFFYTGGVSDRIKVDQVENYAKKIISSAESVFYSGQPSRVTINAYLPSGVENLEIEDNSLRITYTTNSGTNTVSYSSNVPIQGSLSSNSGVKKINVVASANTVQLSES